MKANMAVIDNLPVEIGEEKNALTISENTNTYRSVAESSS